MNARLEPSTPDVDPMVADMITSIRDRFGAEGLRDVIRLATEELAKVQEAEEQLASLDQPSEPAVSAPITDSADTQAWLAYTEAEPDDDLR